MKYLTFNVCNTPILWDLNVELYVSLNSNHHQVLIASSTMTYLAAAGWMVGWGARLQVDFEAIYDVTALELTIPGNGRAYSKFRFVLSTCIPSNRVSYLYRRLRHCGVIR